MSADRALDIELSVNQAGGGQVHVVMHDDSIEERLQLLNARGAKRRGNKWFLETADMGAFADGAEYIIKMVSDLLTPKETPGDARQEAFDRDDYTCRICGVDFNAPLIAASAARQDTQVLDHIYPQHEAKPLHKPHDLCNLVTVCGGCDDVFLQGDNFRFVRDHVGYDFPPLDEQILAWVQKRGIARSDWVTERINEYQGEHDSVKHDVVNSRLKVLAGLDVVYPLADIAKNEGFQIYCVNPRHKAVVFLDQPAVQRHERLHGVELLDEGSMDYISMDHRKGNLMRFAAI